ncbi:hypothetical protein EIP91_005620 [Steccherinum ochraceum]|uniref:Uncharacterized protein n=1 Tax=Steccherinum ochraceum TaxID=92696 RepID=A0A4V2MVP0_9APHY|nr:hypothetical protein EIP91_005620 [Steccherinum ochraceum]
MAAKTQPATSSSRLSLFGFGSLSRAATSSHTRPVEQAGPHEQDEDDWYIPYNGPVERPTRQSAAPGDRDRDSWGDILSGWLSERGSGPSYNAREDAEQMFQSTRSRALSNASQMTTSSVHRTGRTLQHRPSVPSFIDLDKAGGVGASPMPMERSQSTPQPAPLAPVAGNRASLASILSFGKKSLHHSSSMEQLTRERGSLRRRVNTTASTTSPPIIAQTRQRANDNPSTAHGLQREPIAEDNEYYYSSLLVHSSVRGVPSRQSPFSVHSASTNNSPHPYAAVPGPPEPRKVPPAPPKHKTRFLDPSKLNLTLLDPRGPKVPDYLKPSPRNSVLKASASTPNLRDIPRGKQRWLSAETWCDALILPRPRFAMRLVEGGPSGRIVSPPDSPLSPSEAKFPLTGTRSGSTQSYGNGSSKSLKKSRSMGNLFGAGSSAAVSPVKEKPATPVTPVINEPGPSRLVPNRPKSWALDDLAIPSPVPSLAQVVKEGERLKAERQQWQTKATQSFQNKRTRSVRARSKSVSASQTRARTVSASAQANAFDFLAERTLLGSQVRPPTIHVHGPPSARHARTASSGGQTRTSSFSHPTTSNPHVRSMTTSRTRSHGHSNSVGQVSYRSMTDSTIHGHVRSQSLSKSALQMVKSTAVGAAAFCGFNGADRSPSVLNDERANAFEGALRGNGTAMFKVGEHGNVTVFSTASPTAALAMVSPSHAINGIHGASPTPSGFSVSAEGVGIAISSPEDQPPHKPEPQIIIPAHPYAQGSNYYRPGAKPNAPEYTPPDSTSTSPHSPHSARDSVTQRRQPVTRSYMPTAHPYASAVGQGKRPKNLEIDPADSSIYAELTPGHISEFDPDQMRYSPYVISPVEGPEEEEPQQAQQHLAPTASGHPYGPSTARYSELGFGEALTHTLRTQTSMDSGLGTSEAGGHSQAQGHIQQGQGATRQPEYTSPPVILQSPDSDELNKQTPGSYFDQESPGNVYQRAAAASSQALVSSPLDSTPPFRRRGSSGGRLSTGDHGRSSGSSPGLISQASSPPLSPRPLPVPGDLDRFRDLFYRPADRASSVSSDSPLSRPGPSSRQNSLPLDVSSTASRSVSGLTNLARQLSEDLEELREVERDRSSERDSRDSRMWGRRFGGLRGERPEDMDDPNLILSPSQLSSDSSSPGGSATLPLRLPTDTSFVDPSSNYPEDIRMDETESSRASSVLEGSNFHDDPAQYLRVGEVEAAILTPNIVTTPHRESTRLSVIEDEDLSPDHRSDGLSPLRVRSRYSSIPSRYSSISAPFTPNAARASYMTSDTDPSRMSGLSDFPVPPSQTIYDHIVPTSSSGSYQTSQPEDSEHTSSDTQAQSHPQGQALLRERSKDTFGIQHDYDSHIGEAF